MSSCIRAVTLPSEMLCIMHCDPISTAVHLCRQLLALLLGRRCCFGGLTPPGSQLFQQTTALLLRMTQCLLLLLEGRSVIVICARHAGSLCFDSLHIAGCGCQLLFFDCQLGPEQGRPSVSRFAIMAPCCNECLATCNLVLVQLAAYIM